MAFASIQPAVLNLNDEAYKIRRGATYLITITIKDSTGTPVDCSEYAGAAPKCEFRTTYLHASPTTGVTTGCPQPTMAWLSGGAGGQMSMEIAAADSTAATVLTGVYDIEITHSGGKKNRPVMGAWAMDDEVTGI
jgi:hypothetical protein